MSVAHKLLLHAMLLSLMVGSIAGLFVGVLMVLRPSWLLHASARVNRWVATRHITNFMEKLIKVDRWFYRYHQISGIFLLSGAVFLIYFFSARFDKPRMLPVLFRAYPLPPALIDVLLDSAVLSILLGAVLVLIVGLFLLIRPSMLRGFELGANQWISLRRALRPFEISRFGVDEYLFQSVQMVGLLLLFGSLYTMAVLTAWL